ncbi:MAG: energy-coupling factor ABC transporter permease [Burkholderiales bacterium]
MNLTDGLLTPAWQAALWAAWLVSFIPLVRGRAWRALAAPDRLNLWLAAIAAALTLWLIRAGIRPGLELHLLGATVLTLMFGAPLAQLAVYLVTALATALGTAGADAYPANALLAGALPVWVSHAMLRIAARWLPPNVFVYIFVAGFFGGAAAMAATAVGTTGLHLMLGTYGFTYLAGDYLPFALLLAWGEAFVTGMLITLMVVYHPGWVSSFDDARYLRQR